MWIPFHVILSERVIKIGGSIKLDVSKLSKALHHNRHVGLDLSLCLYVHFQVTGCLLKNICPTCGTKRYVKLSDFPLIFCGSLHLLHKVNQRLW
jgi:hypothetical protein